MRVDYTHVQAALFPGHPHLLFFGLHFIIIHRSERVAKNMEGLGMFIMSMASGGCEVDVEEGRGVGVFLNLHTLVYDRVSYR